MKPQKHVLARLCETMTALEIADHFGVNPPAVCKWTKAYQLKPLRGSWGGSRRRPSVVAPVYVPRDLPLPATPGALRYWAQA